MKPTNMNRIHKSIYFFFMLILMSLLSTLGYSQTKYPVIVDGHPLKDIYLPNSLGHFQRNEMPNSLKVTPQLIDKLPKNSRGFDAYKLKDGMSCIAPDSSIQLKLTIVNPKQKLF